MVGIWKSILSHAIWLQFLPVDTSSQVPQCNLQLKRSGRPSFVCVCVCVCVFLTYGFTVVSKSMFVMKIHFIVVVPNNVSIMAHSCNTTFDAPNMFSCIVHGKHHRVKV